MTFNLSVMEQAANEAIDWIEDTARDLGLSFQPKKMVQPTTCLEFLGLELNSASMEARIPLEKLSYLQETLLEWETCRCCNLKDLQGIIGHLQFCTEVVPHSHMWCCRADSHEQTAFCVFVHSPGLRYIMSCVPFDFG